MLSSLGLDAGNVPASNVAFVRSRRLATLATDFTALAEACWPFHARVLEVVRPRLVVCLGSEAGDFVRAKLSAFRLTDSFTEANNRRWQSSIYVAMSGPGVAVVTHPSIANWRTAATDPTPLLRRSIHGA
jgi:uracil-DNA glycosylase family 4